jgi:hypothetical protein
VPQHRGCVKGFDCEDVREKGMFGRMMVRMFRKKENAWEDNCEDVPEEGGRLGA